MDILNDKIRKANKPHKCDWCGCEIAKGEEYRDTTLVNDGIYQWKSHLKCDYIFNKLNMDSYDDADGVNADTYREYVREYIQDELNMEEAEAIICDGSEIEVAYTLLKREEATK